MVQPFHLRFLLLCLQYDVFTPFPTLPTPRLRPSCFAPDGSSSGHTARHVRRFCGKVSGNARIFFCSFKHSQATVRADIRIRIRRRIIRIRINEPRIRTIIRITAEQHATTPDNPFYFFPTSWCATDAALRRRRFRFAHHDLRFFDLTI
jgi:hypothetical protein